MKSTLKIDLHNDGNRPMIIASVSTDRSDLRDSVMNKFFSSLETVVNGVDLEQGHLCFVEGFGRENNPESYIYTIHPIVPGEEDRYINRLQLSQAKRIIPLAFQMFNSVDRNIIIAELTNMDKEFCKKESEITGLSKSKK